MQSESKIKIVVDKSHLFTLGEKMYRESKEFIRELVSNAYDADATEARILIEPQKIIIQDNGSGMNAKGLEQFFTIGSPEKRERSVSPRFGRKRIGQFGIGKFSALALADQFIIESRKGKFKYSVIFDRNKWQESDSWNLPIRKEAANPLDKEGTTVILNKLTKKISISEVEKYLRESVPLRAKKFSVFLNNKKISAKIITGKILPIKTKTFYGTIEGEIIIALNPRDVDEPGVECRVKQVFIKRDFFGVEKKHLQGANRVAGYVNADFLPLISSRSDFIIDSPEYKMFAQLMRAELEKVLQELKKQTDAKNLKKITKELQETMKQIREALTLNPDFVPQGRAVARLKKEGKKKMAAASANIREAKEQESPEDKEDNVASSEKIDKLEKKDLREEKKQEIEAKPLVVKRIRMKKLGISCGIVSLGEEGPEVASQGNAVYINQDHPVYQKLYKKSDLLNLHLLRLLTQEIVLMKKLRITSREAFDYQSKLLRDSIRD